MPVGDARPQISEVLTETERELQHLRHEIEMLTKAGVIEVAIRNPSVREYMNHWEKRAEKAEAALEAAALDAQGAQWQPIETAPKDGTRVIVGWDDIAHMPMHAEMGRYKQGRGPDSGWCNTYGHPFSGDPTHWWPLPPRPRELLILAERERCAKIAEKFWNHGGPSFRLTTKIASAIRAEEKTDAKTE